jgi:hypothetical protein
MNFDYVFKNSVKNLVSINVYVHQQMHLFISPREH